MLQQKKYFKKVISSLKTKIRKFFLKNEVFYLKAGDSKFKIFLKRLRLKNLLLFFLSPFLLVFIYYLFSFFNLKESDLCLESLRLSFQEDLICREECSLYRLENKKCLLEGIKKNKSFEKKVLTYLKKEDLNLGFRLELVDVFRLAYDGQIIPDFLFSCLEETFLSEKIKAEIFKSFSWEFSKEEPLAYYLKIIDSEASLELRLAATLKISSFDKKAQFFSLDDLDLIKRVIFDNQTPIYLRQSLVLLLGDYLRYFPEETRVLLAEIEAFNFRSDNISRAFAADFIGLELPEVSQEEWSSYFNQ